MEKPKHLTDEQPKKKEKAAQVEFVAPYPLPDCVLRIRDTKHLDTGFMSPGIDPSYEKTEPGVYHFKIKRTWYDYRSRRHQAMVELDGYLKGIDATSTVVIAKTRVSWTATLVIVMLIGLLFLSGVLTPQKGGIVFIIGAVVMLVFYVLLVAWDRRTLVRLIHRAMSDDVV